jgi:tripartite-type tricarboxylate transporter receptor subunit TctC
MRAASKMLMKCLLFAPALLCNATPAPAQDYPTKEIYSICPFGPGTGADIVVRYFSAKLQERLGKPVVVLNKPGATGNIATEFVARSRPDGYTISITPASSTMASAVHLYKKLAFDPIKDFAPVTTLSSLAFVLIVDSKKPIHSVADLTKHLKQKQGGGFYGGSANTGIIAAEMYKKAAGVKAERVNFRNIADTLKEMIGGQIDFTFSDASWVRGQTEAGRVRPLGVTSAKRTAAFPGVPTMIEAGMPGFDLSPWWGVFVPAGTPQPIVDKLAAAFNAILATPETKEFLARFANDPMPGTPDSLRQLLASEVGRWGEMVKLAGIEPQ